MKKETKDIIETSLIMIGVFLFIMVELMILDAWWFESGLLVEIVALILIAIQWVFMTVGIKYTINRKEEKADE